MSKKLKKPRTLKEVQELCYGDMKFEAKQYSGFIL